jgi:hypothetical protein
MAIQNINTIQNHDDLAYILDNSNKYMYESLSNLGQRYSLEGDGITNHIFDIKSLLSYVPENDNYKLISKLVVINDKLILELYNIANNFELVYSEEIKHTINNSIYTDTKIQLNQKINGIDYYNENMLIYLDNSNNTLNISSLGSDNDLGIIEMNIESYNIVNNILLESLKLININSDKYYLYYLRVNNENLDSKLKRGEMPEYFLEIAKIDINYINKLYVDFTHFATFIYNSIVREYFKEFKTITINEVYYEILQIGFEKEQNGNNNYTFNVTLDDNEQQGFYSNEVLSVDNNILHYIYNQYVHMYKFIFEYYCNYIYKLDNKQLNRYLIYSLYAEFFNKSGKNMMNGFGIYLPLNYTIDYFCKNNDPFYIYSNETPINVLYTNKNITFEYIKNFFVFENNEITNNKIILASSNEFETVVLYKFSVEYNKKFENIINAINVSELYSTPYILDDYWVVNGIKSVYKAIGENAGNPNIIMVYTHDINNANTNNAFIPNEHYTVLTSINYENLNKTQWAKETVNIELQQKVNNSSDEIFRHNFLIPVNIPEKYNSLYENALIINLSHINNIADNSVLATSKRNNIITYLGAESCVTTFWIYKNGKFECIKKPNNNNIALTLLDISNVENIISSTIDKKMEERNELDDYIFNKITLKSSYKQLKNEVDEEQINYLISLKNYTAQEQLKNINTENPYVNNLMLKLYTEISNSKSGRYLSNIISSAKTFEQLYYPEGQIYNSTIKEYNSFLPAVDVPILNLSEYLATNINNINRINLITFPNEKGKKPYYSYIGIGNNKLNELHIGSNSMPLSLASLATNEELKDLSKQDTLSFDFDTIKHTSKYTIHDINYTYTYSYTTEENKTVSDVYNVNVNKLNISLDVYHIASDSNTYCMLNTKTGVITNNGNLLNDINMLRVKLNNKLSETDNSYTVKDTDYIAITEEYIINLIKHKLNLDYIDPKNITVTNLNKVKGYNQNKDNFTFYYYIIKYDPITYLVDLDVCANSYLNTFSITNKYGKLLPFEIYENPQISE